MSLSRKYRPRIFKNVIGQDHVVKTLQAALSQGQPAHAYLFSGIQGVGKTTIARLLAKTVNCLNLSSALERKKGGKKGNQLAEPCNKCENCAAFSDLSFMDVIEMDAASNRGVEEIEEVIRAVHFPPSKGRYKVYIIDEVHMLTKHAFNALLKTLEEPPSHVIFVLATTEPDKVPATIISRCQWFAFRKITARDIQKRLAFIARQEGYDLAPKALELIALSVRGSTRDAESVLTKVLSLSAPGEKITLDKVRDVLGMIEMKLVRAFINASLEGDIKKAYQVLAQSAEASKDMRSFADEVINYLRRMALVNIDKLLLMGENITKDEAQWIAADAKKYSNKRLMNAIPHFLKAREDAFLYPAPQLALEVAAVKINEKD